MNRGNSQASARLGGYTIVETLIFLAVSASMFIMAALLVGGQQNKAQFVNAVRDFETKLTDIANDVSTGYYQNTGKFSCTAPGGAPTPVYNDPSSKGLGTNDACIFVGTVVKFGAGGLSESARGQFVQYAVAGARVDATSGLNITSLSASKPKVLNDSSVYATNTLGYGASVQCVGLGPTCNAASDSYGAVGFFTKFLGTSVVGGNSIQTDVLAYPDMSPIGVHISDNQAASVPKIDSVNNNPVAPAYFNTPAGVTICLKSGGTSQYALIHLGGGGSNLTFKSEIKSYSGATPPCN